MEDIVAILGMSSEIGVESVILKHVITTATIKEEKLIFVFLSEM